MRVITIDPPRKFFVGAAEKVEISDCAKISLQVNEQITLTTERGGEYDIVRKEWGFYATPSLNDRLPRFGLRPALVASPSGRFYVMLVECGRETAFEEYLAIDGQKVVAWLDDKATYSKLERK